MRIQLKPGLIMLAADDAEEAKVILNFSEAADSHVFHLIRDGGTGCALHDLGSRVDACREPINITFNIEDRWRPISNLALTPFELDGRTYASIEGFWQGLKFDDALHRARVAFLHGWEAKRAGREARNLTRVSYAGKDLAVGGREHWALMLRACRAKFRTNGLARQALLATGDRPLTHRVRRDSRTIPGVIMADIWMRIRATLKARPEFGSLEHSEK